MPKINDVYDIGAAFEAIENELMTSMIRNMRRHKLEEIKEDKQWAMWQAMQLESLEKYKKENQKKYGKQFKDINARIKTLISLSRSEGEMNQEIAILEAIRKGFPLKRVSKGATAEFFKLNDRKLEALIKATTDDMEKAETAVLRMADDQYRKIIYNAQVYANTGAGTYEKAVDMAASDMEKSGLNCVEYANGARHTLSDYADMAIRTACKRAYLQGEGQKRQEWGISTVLINKRGNPCPKCLPFVGKVLIDDVWSGGSKDGKSPITGKTYPLMSKAIAAGLYHPRCKDSHTTYFEGISKPPEENGYTDKDLDDIAERAEKENRLRYAKRQAKKYERMSNYSMDPNNQEQYALKQKEWENVAKELDPDIIESDLGKFKEKLKNDTNISKGYYERLKEKFSHGSDDAKKLFTKYADGDTVMDSAFKGTPHFNVDTKRISMNYRADVRNERGAGVTWFHEHGHLIDSKLGWISDDKEFMNLLKQDSLEYRLAYGKTHKLKTFYKIDDAISRELNDMHKHSAVSDMLEGVTQGNIVGIAGHSPSYWSNEKNITAEAFAHMFESQFDKDRYGEMKKYFPKSLEYFEKKMKEAVK